MSFLFDEAQAPDPRDLPDPLGPVESSATWRRRDRLGLAFAWFAGLGFCVICGAIVVFLGFEGLRYLVVHPSLLWKNPTAGDSQGQTGGFLAPLLGTLLITAMAMVLATPVGVAIAVWLSEYSRPRALARLVESSVEMIAGAPSVVLALFGLLVFGTHIFSFLSQSNGSVVTGKSFLTATPMLALLGLPLVVTTTREGLQAIPNHVREASLAVGKTKITTIRRVLLPAARPSVITGASLSTAHVIGDTAIILLLLGDTSTSSPLHPGGSLSLFSGSGSTLTSYIYDSAPTGDLNQPQKAFAAALVLLVIVLALNLIVDVFGNQARNLKWN
jgi:phosphate transport system permease protein